MKKLFQSKYFTMLGFLCVLGVMFLFAVLPVRQGFIRMMDHYRDTGEIDFGIVETGYIDSFKGKDGFLNLNGAYQRLMGARVLNERYKLDNGHLTYIIPRHDMQKIASQTVLFRDVLEEQGIPLVYVNTPFKIHSQDKQLPVSIEDYSNENADEFLSILEDAGVTVLDLRQNIAREGIDHYDMYYKTDHHWTAESGLWAAGRITEFLASLDADFRVNSDLLDPTRFNYNVYEDVFLGSAGRRTGSLYSGKDDFTVITPTFETQFLLNGDSDEIVREGDFREVFIDESKLTAENQLESNTYQTYCGKNFAEVEITNSGSEATPKKILLIRDSYSDVLIPFLALGYEQLNALDLRLYQDVMDYVEQCDPDLVMVVYNPGVFEPHNFGMFDFVR